MVNKVLRIVYIKARVQSYEEQKELNYFVV